jgi:hypothetical protein
MGFYGQIRPYAAPFFLGGLLLSAIGAAVSYPVAYLVISAHRGRRPDGGTERLPPETGLG